MVTDEFPISKEFTERASQLLNQVMYHKLNSHTKFWKFEKAHKNYFKVIPEVKHDEWDIGFKVVAGPDSTIENVSFLFDAMSEKVALIACLRAAVGSSLLIDDCYLLGLDTDVKMGLKSV